MSGVRAGGEPVQVVHEVLIHVPVGGEHEKGPAVGSAEGAGEPGLIKLNSIKDLAALGHP
jgi:hypothetical protein